MHGYEKKEIKLKYICSVCISASTSFWIDASLVRFNTQLDANTNTLQHFVIMFTTKANTINKAHSGKRVRCAFGFCMPFE